MNKVISSYKSGYGYNGAVSNSPVITDKIDGMFSYISGGKNYKPSSVRNAPPMEIAVDKDVYDAVSYVVHNVNTEVGWYCASSIQVVQGSIVVSIIPAYEDCPLIVPEQEVHAATAEILPTWYKKEWPDKTPEEYVHLMNTHATCWGHSHVNMAVNPSCQDISTLDYLSENNTNNYYVAMIANKSGHIRFDVIINNEGMLIKYEDVKWYLQQDFIDNKALDLLHKNLKSNVSSKSYYSAKTPVKSSNKPANNSKKIMPTSLAKFKPVSQLTQAEIEAELAYYDSADGNSFLFSVSKYSNRYLELIEFDEFTTTYNLRNQ